MADSFPDAARRHWSDAKQLAANDRFQNAGHLLGFAAECLAKEALQSSSIIKDTPDAKQWSHFPRLADRIRTDGRSRAMIPLLPIITNPAFLDGWQAECRYEANITRTDAEKRFHAWHADVDSLFKAAGNP